MTQPHPTRPAIVITAHYHVGQALRQFEGVRDVISIMGQVELDLFGWPEYEDRSVLRLQFDDVGYSSRGFRAVNPEQIESLIGFARDWGGRGTLLCQCRAGVSRSSAAALVAAASLPGTSAEVLGRIISGRSYFRPNRRMLELADAVLGRNPTLIETLRSTLRPDRTDDWSPVRVWLG